MSKTAFTHEIIRGRIEAMIIDPAKVTRTALQNGASIAGLIITPVFEASRDLSRICNP